MLQYIKEQWQLGRRIYGKGNIRNNQRTIVFTARSLKNKPYLEGLTSYFANYEAFPQLLDEHVRIYEVVSRIFLYKDSTNEERLQTVKDHFDFLPAHFTKEAIYGMYKGNCGEQAVRIWENEELSMHADLFFDDGNIKEGYLCLYLFHDNQWVYHINFRFGKGLAGEDCIWVGTIQGYKQGLDHAKKVTKKMHSYRPKNFVFFLLRQLAKALGNLTIYAVSDEGFYTNTHLIRGNRSKQVDFNPFWVEMGGYVSDDERFYILPLDEPRKTYETAKTHKRNMYRKRYEMLDAFAEEISLKSKDYLLK